MNTDYFSQSSPNYLEKTYHQILALNINAVKEIAFITPEELFKIHNPEDFLDENMELFVSNGHMALDYVHDVFSIMEEYWLSSFNRIGQGMLNEANLSTHKNIKSLKKTGQQVKKIVATNLKAHSLVSKKNKKKAASQPHRISSGSKNIRREIH